MSLRMRWGYTVDTGEFLSRMIAKITQDRWSHVFPVFYSDNHAEPYYYESIWSKDKDTGKTGVRGPRPLSKVWDWMQEDTSRHLHTMQPTTGFLPFTPTECEAAKSRLIAATYDVKYARSQIALNYLMQMTGIRLAFRLGSTRRWTCSETCVRVTPRRLQHYFGIPNLSADDIPPSGNKLVSVWSGTEAMLGTEDGGSG